MIISVLGNRDKQAASLLHSTVCWSRFLWLLWVVLHGPWMYRHYCVMLTWNHFSIISLSATAVSYDSATCIFFFSWGPSLVPCIIEVQIYNHTNSFLVLLNNSHAFSTEFVVCFLENSHLVWDKMEFQCSLVLFCIFLCLKWMNIFIYLLTI